MRLIDADTLKTYEQLEPMGNGNYKSVLIVYKNDIENAPTIDYPIEQIKWERDVAIEQLKSIGKGLGEKMDDVQPVKRGKWTRKESKRMYWYVCSECGGGCPCNGYGQDMFTEWCPTCGARMIEGSEE